MFILLLNLPNIAISSMLKSTKDILGGLYTQPHIMLCLLLVEFFSSSTKQN